MSNKNLRRLSVLVNSQTEYHLRQLAQLAGHREIGREIDKLVREKMLKGGGTNRIPRKNRAAEAVPVARCKNRKPHGGDANMEGQSHQNHQCYLTRAKIPR